jgi:3-hydroxyisobutyrate dehydrogenase
MAKIAFLGMGVMGFPMAGHLAKAGHDVTVYNRTRAKADAWTQKHKGRAAATPAEAADGQDFVLACVGNDNDLRSVIYGDTGAFKTMRKGAIFVDHTTASAEIAREFDAEARKRGFGFIDAPVSGGQSGAENAQLGIMCGGDEATYATAEPVLKIYAKAITLIGPAGAGQLTKMVNQICIAGLVQALSEGMNFAVKSGLDTEKVLSVITAGAAGSWQMSNRAKTMVQNKFDFGFAVDWMRKDLGICLAEAQRNKARLPVTALVDQFYAQVQARGGGRWDTSSLVHLLAKD